MESWCRSEVKWKLFKKFSRTVAVKFNTTEITTIGIITQLKLKKGLELHSHYLVKNDTKINDWGFNGNRTKEKLISYLILITFKKCPLLFKFVLFFEA